MFKRIKRYFFTGLLVMLPLFLSCYILFILFRFADGILGKFINAIFKENFGFYIPGLGLILLALIIITTGFLSSYFFGRKIYNIVDRLFSRFPLVRYIYPSLKQIFEFLFSAGHPGFKKAVLVHFPTPQSWTIGFITNHCFKEANEKSAQELLNIFVPLSPNPISGFIIFAEEKDVIMLDITIEEAMRIIVSGGLLNPGR